MSVYFFDLIADDNLLEDHSGIDLESASDIEHIAHALLSEIDLDLEDEIEKPSIVCNVRNSLGSNVFCTQIEEKIKPSMKRLY